MSEERYWILARHCFLPYNIGLRCSLLTQKAGTRARTCATPVKQSTARIRNFEGPQRPGGKGMTADLFWQNLDQKSFLDKENWRLGSYSDPKVRA
jgi:hypothetical protein